MTEKQKLPRKYKAAINHWQIPVERVYQESDLERLDGKVVELEHVGLSCYHAIHYEGDKMHTFMARDMYRGLLEHSALIVRAPFGKVSFASDGIVHLGKGEDGWRSKSIGKSDDSLLYDVLDIILTGIGI